MFPLIIEGYYVAPCKINHKLDLPHMKHKKNLQYTLHLDMHLEVIRYEYDFTNKNVINYFDLPRTTNKARI